MEKKECSLAEVGQGLTQIDRNRSEGKGQGSTSS